MFPPALREVDWGAVYGYPPRQPAQPTHEADGGITYEVDPDFLEHVRREACQKPELPWDD